MCLRGWAGSGSFRVPSPCGGGGKPVAGQRPLGQVVGRGWTCGSYQAPRVFLRTDDKRRLYIGLLGLLNQVLQPRRLKFQKPILSRSGGCRPRARGLQGRVSGDGCPLPVSSCGRPSVSVSSPPLSRRTSILLHCGTRFAVITPFKGLSPNIMRSWG